MSSSGRRAPLSAHGPKKASTAAAQPSPAPAPSVAIAQECAQQLERKDDGNMTDDAMQLLCDIMGDVALCDGVRTAQLDMLCLAGLLRLESVEGLASTMLEQSNFPLLHHCHRLVGSMFLESETHWISFEVGLPASDPDVYCRNMIIYDSLMSPDASFSFVCRPTMKMGGKEGNDYVPNLQMFPGDFGSPAIIRTSIGMDLRAGITRLLLLLEIYYHKLAQMYQRAQGHMLPEDMELYPDFGALNFYLITLRGHRTRQPEGRNDCGIYALAHRQQLLCKPTTGTNTRSSAAMGMHEKPTALPLDHYLKKMVPQRQDSQLYRDATTIWKKQIIASTYAAAAGGGFAVPVGADIIVRNPEALRQKFKEMLAPNWLSFTKFNYAPAKVIQWVVTRLLRPRRYDDDEQGTAVRQQVLILAATPHVTATLWTDWITNFLITVGLYDYWRIVLLPELLEDEEMQAQGGGGGGGHPNYSLMTPDERAKAVSVWDQAEIFLSICVQKDDPDSVRDMREQCMYARKFVCHHAERMLRGESRATVVTCYQRSIPSGLRPAYCNNLDWATQIISGREVPLVSRPLPAFFRQQMPDHFVNSQFVEHDNLDMSSQGYVSIPEDCPKVVDMSKMPTRLYTIGWDAHEKSVAKQFF